MEQKAFVFSYSEFEQDLKPIIVNALATGRISDLRSFIVDNRSRLKDPYEGEPLDPSWESMIESRDPHQYGDFALTMYYDPRRDIGLGARWLEFHERWNAVYPDVISPVLGDTCSSNAMVFDPGKIGSYFQSERLVAENMERLMRARETAIPGAIIDPVLSMLEESRSRNRGLYVTF